MKYMQVTRVRDYPQQLDVTPMWTHRAKKMYGLTPVRLETDLPITTCTHIAVMQDEDRTLWLVVQKWGYVGCEAFEPTGGRPTQHYETTMRSLKDYTRHRTAIQRPMAVARAFAGPDATML